MRADVRTDAKGRWAVAAGAVCNLLDRASHMTEAQVGPTCKNTQGEAIFLVQRKSEVIKQMLASFGGPGLTVVNGVGSTNLVQVQKT